MSQFHPEDFRDSIDNMCDDALRRMYAFQEGHLSAMQPGDHYLSVVEGRDELCEVVEYDTQTKAVIADGIHRDVVEGRIPDYLLNLLSGAAVALSRHAAFRGHGASIVALSHDFAKNHLEEKLLLAREEISNKRQSRILSYELGSLGTTSLVIGPREEDWELYYDAHHRVSLVRY